MDTLLIAVTALSLLMAGAMAVIVTKLLADQRRRSDARVAALADMAAADSMAWVYRPSPGVARPAPAAPAHHHRSETPAADLPLRPVHPAADRGLGAEPADGQSTVGELFAQPERASAWPGRLAVAVALAVVVTGSGWALSRATTDEAGARAAAAQPPPLELLSLRHTRTADSLTIAGLVRNPPGAAPLSHVVATAVVFGPDSTIMADGRAPLDFITTGGGDEAPFVITIPVSAAVARYRVSFRAQDGTVISHVDGRRNEN